jgi:hypothetical protein
MARRQCAERFESKKKARKQAKKDERRKENTKTERESVIIACEDSVSAPLYFRSIFKDLTENHVIAASSFVIVKHGHTDPQGVLQDLLEYPDCEYFTHKWIVIDRDEERTNGGGHLLENYCQAITQAAKNKIKVAYSNPCFELWYLLHFEYRNTAIDRDEAFENLEQRIEYAKNKLPNLSIDQQNTAIRNAQNLIKSCIATNGQVNPETDNPSTTVHELVIVLNNFKQSNV